MGVHTDTIAEIFDAYDEWFTREPVYRAMESNETSSEEHIPGAEEAEPVDLTPLTRPNGEQYIPRKLPFGGSDVSFVQTAYEKRMPVLLFGPPGTGKTALFEAALPNLITVMGTAETEVADFLGSWIQRTDGTYEWIDGPLVIAAETGRPLLIDEIALIDSRTMAVVYALMDGRDELPITANPARGTVKVTDGFLVVGACNPDVPGALMSDALVSRFKLHVEVTTDWSLAYDLGVGSRIITVAKHLASRSGGGAVVAPPQLRELLTFRDCAETYGTTVALRNFIGQARAEDRHAFAEAVASVYGDTHAHLTF